MRHGDSLPTSSIAREVLSVPLRKMTSEIREVQEGESSRELRSIPPRRSSRPHHLPTTTLSTRFDNLRRKYARLHWTRTLHTLRKNHPNGSEEYHPSPSSPEPEVSSGESEEPLSPPSDTDLFGFEIKIPPTPPAKPRPVEERHFGPIFFPQRILLPSKSQKPPIQNVCRR
jgi:site-specific DNA-cytosine methylase